MKIPNEYKKNIYLASLVFLIVLSFYFAIKSLSELKSYNMIESSRVNTITLSGYGEVNAVPNIANVYFSIKKESKTVKEAQTLVAQIENKSIDFLKKNNILEKDIKTSNASFYPKYEYKYNTKTTIPCNGYNCPPRQSKKIISGYIASESITVKVRNVDIVGKIMQGLGSLSVSNLNGPNFSIDNEDGLKAEARRKAINNAKEKARTLANDLGIGLGKIVSFSESANYPRPMYFNRMTTESISSKPVVAKIPKGENTISSNVSITYEIN